MLPDNLILTRDATYTQIKKALSKWIDLHCEEIGEGVTFQLYRNGDNSQIITADEMLSNKLFYSLVGDLRYLTAEGEKGIKVAGYTTGREYSSLQFKRLLVYCTPEDDLFDRVSIVTHENKSYKFDSYYDLTDSDESALFREPRNLKFENPATIVTGQPKPTEESIQVKSELWVNIRFLLLTLTSLGLLIYFDTQYPGDVMKINSLCYVATLWVLFDRQILQSGRRYGIWLTISIVSLFLPIIVNQAITNSVPAALHVTLFLIFYRPVTLLYKAIFKREPDFADRSWGQFFGMVTFMAALALSLVIFKHIKNWDSF